MYFWTACSWQASELGLSAHTSGLDSFSISVSQISSKPTWQFRGADHLAEFSTSPFWFSTIMSNSFLVTYLKKKSVHRSKSNWLLIYVHMKKTLLHLVNQSCTLERYFIPLGSVSFFSRWPQLLKYEGCIWYVTYSKSIKWTNVSLDHQRSAYYQKLF